MTEWRYRGGEREVGWVIEAWRAGRPVVLTGPTGIGKTSLAREAARRSGAEIVWVVGTASTRDTPLGALTATVPIGAGSDPLQALESLRARLIESTTTALLVEGAADLDAGTAAILAALVAGRGPAVPIIVMLRRAPGAVIPGRLAQALEAADAAQFEVPALGRKQVRQLIEDVVGAPVDAAAAGRIHLLAEGNPFFATQLARGALAAGSLVRDGGRQFTLTADPPVTDELRAAVADTLARAAPEQRRLLGLLSVLTPLSRGVIAELSLVQAIPEPGQPRPDDLVGSLGDQVFPAHAVYTEVMRAELGRLGRRRLVAELAAALGRTAASPIERAQRAQLCLEAGLPIAPAELTEAAAIAYLLGDVALAGRLAAAAVDRGDRLHGLLQQARALSAMGRGADAVTLLEKLDATAFTGDDLGAYALSVALTRSVGLGDHAGALTVLDDAGRRLPGAQWQRAFDAVAALALINDGSPAEALRRARSAQRESLPPWQLMGVFNEAEAVRRLGECRRPRVLATQSLRAAGSSSALIGLGGLRTLIQLELQDARLAAAQDWVQRLLGSVLLDHVPRAIAYGSHGLVLAAEGSLPEAEEAVTIALAALGGDERTGLGRGLAMQLAWVRAARGDVEGSEQAALLCRELTGVREGWPMVNVRLAAAFAALAGGQLSGPADLIRSASRVAAAAGQVADAVWAGYWSVRLGDRAGTTEFLTTARCCEGQLIRMQERHARAVLATDPAALRAAADEFELAGYHGYAADALAQALVVARSRGSGGSRSGLGRRLDEAIARCHGPATPAVRAAQLGVPLSRREFEVLMLRNAGRSRRDIAELLGLAPATVAAVLTRTRDKLG